MATWENVVSYAKGAAETVGKKTDELVELGRMKLKIAELHRELAAAYEGLGRLVYDSRKSGESVDDMVAACTEHLDELTCELEQLEEKVMLAKNAVRCSKCGTPNAATAHFCSQCGEKLNG